MVTGGAGPTGPAPARVAAMQRLSCTPAARPLLERLGELGEDMMTTTLNGVSRETVEQIVAQLAVVKENLRQAIQQRPPAGAAGTAGERHYG